MFKGLFVNSNVQLLFNIPKQKFVYLQIIFKAQKNRSSLNGSNKQHTI